MIINIIKAQINNYRELSVNGSLIIGNTSSINNYGSIIGHSLVIDGGQLNLHAGGSDIDASKFPPGSLIVNSVYLASLGKIAFRRPATNTSSNSKYENDNQSAVCISINII